MALAGQGGKSRFEQAQQLSGKKYYMRKKSGKKSTKENSIHKRHISKKIILSIPQNAFIKTEQGFKSGQENTIQFKVLVPAPEWDKFWSYILNYKDDFLNQFWKNFVLPSIGEIESKKGARGRIKRAEEVIKNIQTDSGFLYAIFCYWNKKTTGELPAYILKIIQSAKKDKAYSLYILPKSAENNYDAAELTAYCIKKLYNKQIKSASLNPFEDPANFYQTYIQANKRPSEVKKILIDGKAQKEIESIIVTQPILQNIFRRLKCL